MPDTRTSGNILEAPSSSRTRDNRKLIALACTGMMQHGFILLAFGPVLPEMMKTFQIRESLAGLMLGFGSLGFMAAPLIAGAIADHHGVRWSLAAGFAVEIVFLLLLGFSPFLFWLFLTIFALKFGAGFVETSLNVIPTLTRSKKPGSQMNLVHMFFSVGALVSPVVVGVLLNAFDSWRPVFWLTMAPTAVLLFLAWKAPFPRTGRSGASAASMPAPPVRRPAGGGAIRDILRNRSVLVGSVVLFLYVGAEIAVSDWIVLYLQKQLGLGILASSSGLTILWAGLLVGRYLNSLLARSRSGRQLVLAAGVLGVISGLCLLAARSVLPAFVCLFLLGLSMSGVFPIVMAELNSRDPSRSGRVTGVLAVAASLGAVVFVPIAGAAAEAVGLKFALGIPAVLMGIVGVLYLLVRDDD